MTFTSTAITADGDDEFTVTGDLTIRGITKPVTIDLEYTGAAKDPFGNDRIGFEGKAEINRKDWGLEWKAALETGGILVGEKVKLELDISAIRS
jgi:polyisoprenoid-binding protein YceI